MSIVLREIYRSYLPKITIDNEENVDVKDIDTNTFQLLV